MQNDQELFMFILEKPEDKTAIYSQIYEYLTCFKELWMVIYREKDFFSS